MNWKFWFYSTIHDMSLFGLGLYTAAFTHATMANILVPVYMHMAAGLMIFGILLMKAWMKDEV